MKLKILLLFLSLFSCFSVVKAETPSYQSPWQPNGSPIPEWNARDTHNAKNKTGANVAFTCDYQIVTHRYEGLDYYSGFPLYIVYYKDSAGKITGLDMYVDRIFEDTYAKQHSALFDLSENYFVDQKFSKGSAAEAILYDCSDKAGCYFYLEQHEKLIDNFQKRYNVFFSLDAEYDKFLQNAVDVSGNYQCPAITSWTYDGSHPTVMISYGSLGESQDMHAAIKLNDSINNETASLSCEHKINFKAWNIDKLNGKDVNITFKKYDTGKMTFCATTTTGHTVCSEDGEALSINIEPNYTLILRFNTEEYQKIFNGSSCSNPEIYTFHGCTTDQGGGYTITDFTISTNKNLDYEEYKCQSAIEEEGGTNLGDPIYGCQVIPDDIREWIKDALNLLKYVALALVIVLGVLDFIKAAASGEAEDMKKSGQSFMKRIIAVIILFLLPVIVDLVLNLIELYGANSTCLPE